MAIRLKLTAAALLLLSFSGSAMAKEPAVLVPSGPWNVEYAPDSCVLARAFGPASAPVYLRMEQFEPSAHFEISLVNSPLISRSLIEDVKVAFGEDPNLGVVRTAALFGQSSNGKPAMNFLLSLREAGGGDPARLAELTAAEVDALVDLRVAIVKDATQVVFKTGRMTSAFAAMKVCMDKLLTSWGFDLATEQNLSKRVQPLNPGKWIRREDYPRSAVDAGLSASIHFRVIVDEDGRVSKCAIQNATEGADFARRTCTVISRRARFQPAVDANGRPVASYFVNTVQWIMGKSRSDGRWFSAEVFDEIRN